MAWLDVRWGMNAWRSNERDDEQGLHFALVTVIDGEVNVHAHRTGDLSVDTGGTQLFHGRIRSQRHVPTSRNRYLAVVVRAIEYDSSSADDRQADYERFSTTIASGARAIVDAGGLPTSVQLETLANSAGLADRRWRDDDDHIGVWAWVDEIFGRPVTDTYDSSPAGEANLFYVTTWGSTELVGEDASWKVAIWPTIRAGSPGTVEEWVTQQHSGPGWMDWGDGAPSEDM